MNDLTLFHSPLFEKIREYLKEHNTGDETIFLFVPYIKTGVLDMLLEGIRSRKVIVTTWNPRDIQFGSSELELYLFCKERNIALYVSQKLHLKVYSAGLESAILATGNISHGGLLPEGNYEAAVMLERLSAGDRLFFENIRKEARLVDDAMYGEYRIWREQNKIEIPEQITLDDIISAPKDDKFLTSALPMTRSVDDLIEGYKRLSTGQEPSEDSEVAACIFHDLSNYGIGSGLVETEFVRELAARFFAHPFIQRIDEFIAPEAYFGRIKEWIQDNCTDVPVPSRRELTGNVQVLLEWFVILGNGRYEVDIPGAKSQRIRKIDGIT